MTLNRSASRIALVALACLALLLGGRASAQEFIATPTPIGPTPENSWFPIDASFLLQPNNMVAFNIRFGFDGAFPSRALIIADGDEFTFELGPPIIVIHSPGPWPDGYDGATIYGGSFSLPDNLIDEFQMDRSALRLEHEPFGDFVGSIVQVPEPCSLALMALVGLALVVFVRRTRTG